MEEVHIIRENVRNYIQLQRRNQRNEISDMRRPISEIRVNPECVSEIANKLKTKLSITSSELHALQNGLMDDIKNVEIFLSTHGALRGLVREISGHDISKKSAAVGCCCNLALGDDKACTAIAKAAGPYLVTALDNLATDLAITSAWALGNLSASGPRVCELLTAQGALAKLINLLSVRGDQIRDATLYALLYFAYSLKDELRPEYLTKMLQALSKHPFCTMSTHLLFVLSCHKEFCSIGAIDENFLQSLLENMVVSIKNHTTNCTQVKWCCDSVYLVRTLANVQLDDNIYNLFINYFLRVGVSEDFRKILISENDVKVSLLWLLGNLFNFNRNHVFFNQIFR